MGSGCISGGYWLYIWWVLVVYLVGSGCISGGFWLYIRWVLVVYLVGSGCISAWSVLVVCRGGTGCISGGLWLYIWWVLVQPRTPFTAPELRYNLGKGAKIVHLPQPNDASNNTHICFIISRLGMDSLMDAIADGIDNH